MISRVTEPLQMDPQVREELAQLRAKYAIRELPPVGDIATRRRNYRRTSGQLMVYRPPVAPVDRHEYRLTTDDGAALRLSWHRRADSDPPGSAVLYLHGGGMIFGLAELGKLYDAAVQTYVAASGVPMLVVDYRVAPEYAYPVPQEDCYAALRWLSANAADLGADPARLGVMGDSAGGGLAAAVCLLARDRGGPSIAQQLLLSPMLDDRPRVRDPGLAPFLTWTYDDDVTGWAALLGEAAGSHDVSPYAAPARATDLRGLPPAYIDVGELEIFRDDNTSYARRLTAAGIPTEIHVHRGCPHTFEWLAPGADVSRRAIGERVRRLCSL